MPFANDLQRRIDIYLNDWNRYIFHHKTYLYRQNSLMMYLFFFSFQVPLMILYSIKAIFQMINILKTLSAKLKKLFLSARSIEPKSRPVRPGKEDHLKRWTSFFETFPVGPNRSIQFWTEISGNFG